MTKRKAIVKFVIICILVMIGVLSLFNWTAIFRLEGRLPYRFEGIISTIQGRAGIDLRGGVLAVFHPDPTIEQDVTGTKLDATVTRLQNMLTARGHFDTTVTRQGTNQIRVEMPGTDDSDAIFEAIGRPAQLTMNVKDSSTIVHFTNEDLRSVEYRQQSLTEHGVVLNFTTQGGNKFWDLLNEAQQGGTIEIWSSASREDPENDRVSTPTVNEVAPGMKQSTVITTQTKDSAERLKTRIESGLFDIILTDLETSVIPATLGAGAMTAGIIACIVGLIFIFIVMFFLYGDLGLLSNLSIIIFVVMFLLALALIEVIQLTLPGIAGIILAIGMACDANILIFERIKDEFRSGKRMAVAVESGFNKTIRTILDANITTVIAALVLYFLGTGPIQGFAITLLLGVVVSMVCSLIVTRSLAKTYLYINPNNERRLRLHKLVLKEKVVQPDAPDAPSQEKPKAKQRVRTLNFGGGK